MLKLEEKQTVNKIKNDFCYTWEDSEYWHGASEADGAVGWRARGCRGVGREGVGPDEGSASGQPGGREDPSPAASLWSSPGLSTHTPGPVNLTE